MQKLLIFKPDLTPFDPQAVERVFRTCGKFTAIRLNTPVGTIVECEYHDADDWTIIRLSGNAETISMNYTTGASLQAALVIQKSLGVPLRMVDDDYNFDLTFSNIDSVEELEAAIDNSPTS